MAVSLPACGGMSFGCLAENPGEPVHSELHLSPRPLGSLARNVILPADVVITMDANFESRVAHATHDVRAFAPDVRPRQQRAIQQRLDAVMFQYRGASDLAEEAGTEHALDGAPGVVSAKRKEKCGLRVVPLERFNQARHAFACAAVGVHVYLECNLLRHTYSNSISKVKQGGDERMTLTVVETRQGVRKEGNAASPMKSDWNQSTKPRASAIWLR